MDEPTVLDNTAKHRFELQAGGKTAFILYKRSPGSIDLTHTEVPAEMRGGGMGSQLVAGTLRRLREEGVKVIASCPFVGAYIERHPESVAQSM